MVKMLLSMHYTSQSIIKKAGCPPILSF